MLETSPVLIDFIKTCKQQGYEDFQIRIPLLEKGWPLDEVQRAFYEIKQSESKKLKKEIKRDHKTVYVYKNSMTIHLSEDVFKTISKRAKKNMLSEEEQVEDIVRRSCVNVKKNSEPKDDVDDLLLKLFSRKNCGRPAKKIK